MTCMYGESGWGWLQIYACALGSCALIRVLTEPNVTSSQAAVTGNTLWPIEGEEEGGEVVEET